ncbi:hypothetical protein [Methylotenera sp.]|uniref:hypothetical protein n=1 Tax=Methylotenera sp. TaxID=2051956 RepID=UPI002730AFA3|nr:hypothetical protein [Methylotenera sp.]MDP2231187.1 hypothetical protein [Methylotenera sp.]
MPLTSEELTVIGTLGGAFIVALSTTIISIVNKRSEEKKHFRELVVKTASEHWLNVAQITTATTMPPLTDYIVHTVKMCDLALNNKLTSENVKTKLHEISNLMDILNDHAKNVSKKV